MSKPKNDFNVNNFFCKKYGILQTRGLKLTAAGRPNQTYSRVRGPHYTVKLFKGQINNFQLLVLRLSKLSLFQTLTCRRQNNQKRKDQRNFKHFFFVSLSKKFQADSSKWNEKGTEVVIYYEIELIYGKYIFLPRNYEEGIVFLYV